jgi:hypothetical protein
LGKPRKITEPEKELRFTRARQALTFVAFGGIFLCITFWMWFSNTTLNGQAINEISIRLVITLILFSLSLICFWAAVNCVRHAFIILTPLGIELFPFWFPSKNLQVIYWTEIDNAIVTGDMKTLEIQCQGGSKVFVALAPITADRLPYLKRAIEGRIEQSKESKDKKGSSEDSQQ